MQSRPPNWQEARAFVEVIAGERDPNITFQVFDDKGEDDYLAAWRFGKLTDPKIRKWLTDKADEGCGVYFTLNQMDGKGRRRPNAKRYTAVGVDFDGTELPESFPIEPTAINQTSPGKYHVFWLIEPGDDFNLWSDTQVRLATFYGGDLGVFDPPRVFRLPGFDHQKGKPFRVKTLKLADFADAQMARVDMDTIRDAHDCDYKPPGARKEGGKSDEPVAGWDNPADVERVKYLLGKAKKPAHGDRNNTAYKMAAMLNDYAISPEVSLELLTEWNEACPDPLPEHEIQHVLRSAPEYKASAAGSKATTDAADDFDDAPASDTDFDDAPAPAKSEVKDAPDWPPPASIVHSVGGVEYQIVGDVKMEPVEWLWKNRIPLGKVSMIAGFPDQGKSQILCNIAARITNGDSWPNGEGICDEKGAVMILAAEDAVYDMLKPRLVAAGADVNQVIAIKSMVKVVEEGRKILRVLNIADDLRKLQAIIKAEAAKGRIVKAIMIDPLNAYYGGAAKADSHKAADMRSLLTPLSEWCATRRIAVIAVSHFNKGSNSHVLYRITDSAAITAVCRAVWYAIREETEEDKPGANEKFFFLPGKKNIGPRMKGIEYAIDAKTVQEDPEIKAPFIVWGKEAKISAAELLGAGKAGSRDDNALANTIKWLEGHLHEGPKAVKWIEEESKAMWIAKKTLERARGALNLKPYWDTAKKPKCSMLALHSVWPTVEQPGANSEFEGEERDADEVDDSTFG